MFWNVTFIYNAFIRTTDHCKVQTAFVSLFYVLYFIIILFTIPLEGHAHSGISRIFVRIFTNFYISENSLKFANFFAEVTNSRSMTWTIVGWRSFAVAGPSLWNSLSAAFTEIRDDTMGTFKRQLKACLCHIWCVDDHSGIRRNITWRLDEVYGSVLLYKNIQPYFYLRSVLFT